MFTRFDSVVRLVFLIDLTLAVHFRGGTISWRPVSTAATASINVSITQSYSFVRSSYNCDSTTIATQSSLGSNSTQLQCVSGCPSVSFCNCITTDVICTDYSITQDLSSGQKISFVNIALGSQFYMSYQDGNWLALATASAATPLGWSITSYVNLVARSDTGLINRPPVVSVLPVVQLPVSVQSVINLLVSDDDGDYVQCRWARLNSIDECGGVCQSVTGSQLLPNCSLIFTPTVSQVYYAAAIMVEDFYSSTNLASPISSTPVQFLIHIYDSPSGCATLPSIIGVYPDQSCITVTIGTSFSFTVNAQIGCTGTTITDFVTVSPIGMIKSTSITATSSTVYSVSFNWTPTTLQVGTQIFCAAAIATYNVQSQQYCLKFSVNFTSNSASCPATTFASVTSTNTPATSGDSPYMKYIFLGIGLAAGFSIALSAMLAVRFFFNRNASSSKTNKVNPSKLPSRDTSTTTLNRTSRK